jgi:hypothetical protein
MAKKMPKEVLEKFKKKKIASGKMTKTKKKLKPKKTTVGDVRRAALKKKLEALKKKSKKK